MSSLSKRKQPEDRESESGRPTQEPKSDSEGRFWCFTVYQNPNGEYVNFPANVATVIHTGKSRKAFKYVCYQEEKCPDTGNLHLQGFCITVDKIKHSALRNAFKPHHFEMSAANRAEAARDYCKKEDSATGKFKYEGGEFESSQQGRRKDLELVHEAIQNDATLHDIISMHFSSYVRYGRNIERAMTILQRPKQERQPPVVYLIIGPSGCGKSLWARHLLSQWGTYFNPDVNNGGAKSFETYAGEQGIFLDELRGNKQYTEDSLLLMCDGGSHKFPGRNVSPYMKHDHVMITSNQEPHEWGYSPSWLSPFQRRLTVVIHADYDVWRLDARARVPSWIAEQDLWLDRASRSFKNPTVEVLEIPCVPPSAPQLPPTSRNFIVPLRRSTSPIYDEQPYDQDGPALDDAWCEAQAAKDSAQPAVSVYDDEFNLSPMSSVTQRFVYDLTQDDE